MEQPNLSYIQDLSGGEKTFEEKIIGIIKKEFPQEKKIYFNNLKAKKYLEASENVHKLKHKISILGLEKGYKIAADFEDDLKENKLNLKDEFNMILEVMTNYLREL